MSRYSRFAFFVLTIASVRDGNAFYCPDDGVHNFTDGSCVYLRRIDGPTYSPVQRAIDECENLNDGIFKWRLPKLDSLLKNSLLENIIQDRFDVDGVELYFWIDLRRDDPSDEEMVDANLWRNPSKWRWQSDNSTLAESFPDTATAPWEPGEPNNNAFLKERCVYADPGFSTLGLKWFDNPCSGVAHMLVCESYTEDEEDIYETNPEEAPEGVNGGTTAAVVIFVVVVVPAAVAAAWFLRRRRRSTAIVKALGRPDSMNDILSSDPDPRGVEEVIGRYRKLLAVGSQELL